MGTPPLEELLKPLKAIDRRSYAWASDVARGVPPPAKVRAEIDRDAQRLRQIVDELGVHHPQALSSAEGSISEATLDLQFAATGKSPTSLRLAARYKDGRYVEPKPASEIEADDDWIEAL